MGTQIFNINFDNLNKAFIQMKNEAGWDTEDKLYWGFYFLDHDLKKLEKFADKLKNDSFQIVEIRNTGDNLYLLHAEQYAIHSAESLFDQCHALANLAIENDIEIFDGWDAGSMSINEGLAS